MNLQAELAHTDARTRALLAELTDEQLSVPYDRGINPPVWEVGHAAFFYEYFLLRALGESAPRMPGYDEIWDSFEIRHERRWREGVVPDRATTLDYYTRVLDEVRGRMQGREPTDEECHLCEYAIAHQNMHIESMIWCRQTLGYAPPSSAIEPLPVGARAEGDAVIEGGRYPVGMRDGFSFDNERPGHDEQVAPFAISRTPVTVGEYLGFVDDGGYERPELWSFGGADWLESEETKRPLYWRRQDDRWQMRHFDRWIDLPNDAPMLHVNYWEAEAYANWAGRRLPTEFEWEAAARGTQGRLYPWGNEMDASRVDMDGTSLGLASVHAYKSGDTPEGVRQMIGGAWEWTSSQFLPYDGFAVDMYPYMSTLQFGSCKVTKGGSCATSSCLIRGSYRQAYHPFRRDAFTGFRTCPLR